MVHRKAKIQLVKAHELGWWWRIVAPNGRTLVHSEIYTRKRNAIKSATNLLRSQYVYKIEEVRS